VLRETLSTYYTTLVFCQPAGLSLYPLVDAPHGCTFALSGSLQIHPCMWQVYLESKVMTRKEHSSIRGSCSQSVVSELPTSRGRRFQFTGCLLSQSLYFPFRCGLYEDLACLTMADAEYLWIEQCSSTYCHSIRRLETRAAPCFYRYCKYTIAFEISTTAK
jgi:hypothetical protein